MSRWTPEDLAEYQSRRGVQFVQSGERATPGYVLTFSSDPGYRLIVIPGAPVPKPRQTQSDKWKKRPAVVRYREWADRARSIAGVMPSKPQKLDVVAYFPLTKKSVPGMPHMVRPDSDNLLKACADALFPRNDSMIHEMRIKKRYDDGGGPRVEIVIY